MFKELAKKIDVRRYHGVLYSTPDLHEPLCALIVFDNEIWSISKRAQNAKEPAIIQFRLQFWFEEIDKIFENTSKLSDDFSNAVRIILKQYPNLKEDLQNHINLHFDKLNDDNFVALQNIWQNYFEMALKLSGVSNHELSKSAAQIMANAIKGDFAKSAQISDINNIIGKLNNKDKSKILPILAPLRLCKKPELFNDIIGEERVLGLRAKSSLFLAISMLKI